MRVVLLLAIIIVAACACNKSSVIRSKSYPDTLQGKWQYSAYYMSIGDPGSWYNVSPMIEWIDLQPNAVVSSNMAPFSDAGSYRLPGSNTIKFMIPSKPDGFLLFQYTLDTVNATLVLSPLNPLCIEGCAIKFKR